VAAHRLFHQKGHAAVDEVMGNTCHSVVTSERNHEVGLGDAQHVLVVAKARHAANGRRTLCGNLGMLIMQPDEQNIGHARELMQIGGVVDGVPMAHADSCDANDHACSLGDGANS
jgi:hypothetical protein